MVVTVLCSIELICIHLQFRRAIIRFVNYFYTVEALGLIISLSKLKVFLMRRMVPSCSLHIAQVHMPDWKPTIYNHSYKAMDFQ